MKGAPAEDLDFPRHPTAHYSVMNLNEYVCLREEFTRVMYVEYLGGTGRSPCTVVYKKARPEQPTHDFPWYSETDVDFCEAKAKELVDKLRNAGWKCGLSRDVLRMKE
jgi:hypothetical protein